MDALNIVGLPLEIQEEILLLLDTEDLIQWKQVSRLFLQLMKSSIRLNYKIELGLAGMTDNPLSPLSYAEKLGKLRSLRDMRRNPRLVSGRSISRDTIYTVSHGLFVQSDGLQLKVLQLPSRILETEECEWTFTVPDLNGLNVASLCIDPAQNLLVLLALLLPVQGEFGSRPGSLHFLALDSGVPHPDAAQSLPPIMTAFGGQIVIEGSLLICHTRTDVVEVEVWNWKTGEVVWRLPPCEGVFCGFEVLDTQHILVMDDHNLSVYSLHAETSGSEGQSSQSPYDALCTLPLPQSNDPFGIKPFLYPSYRCGCLSTTQFPFLSSIRNDAICISIPLEGTMAQLPGDNRLVFVPRRKILSWMQATQSQPARPTSINDWILQCERIELRTSTIVGTGVQGTHAILAYHEIGEDDENGHTDLHVDFVDLHPALRGVRPATLEGSNTIARVTALSRNRFDEEAAIIVVPDHAILEEYWGEDGRGGTGHWQIRYIT
ncbi:hypothetical protein POSPLADRAFT_1142749 [Postia placenta MAD-698-R-SB12]|uniref:F-box domain-containing protein n=1 Tax=Postia placenta MAD-698-R-SB12 TaxID=670580 RepID=A0A1X6N0Z5_9APHY|nr:hypothetical protein POSPLADRAFT_1142749 [Postia placenta MAD-698-R-SB12]OSX62301.1 hypothetical protein POSPLADRAFT_1142749 [Postia placenta MAD-698-R-SB12]